MNIFTRPSVTEFILVRMVVIMGSILALFYMILINVLDREQDVWFDLSLLMIAMSIILLALYVGAKRAEDRLYIINESLKDFSKIDDLSTDGYHFTREFDDINKNLIKVLQRVKKREDDKQKYNTKLKLKNRQRSDMLSAIAHEFRNPISAIMGYAQTLQEDREISRPLQEKFLEKIYINGQKIEDLLSRLILWNKFESGETKLHLSDFDIVELVEDSVNSLTERYKSRVITIEGDSREIHADRTLLEIVLKNLIENAIKYSKDNIVVKIDAKKVTIIDEGSGIKESDIGKITKKFYRVGTYSWDNSMGLGLSIVKNILALHDSKLYIESQEGRGSSFSFKI